MCGNMKSGRQPVEGNPVHPIVMSLESLQKEGEKVMKLIKLMDETFPQNKGQHVLICVMAGIKDAYRAGQEVS